MPPFLHIRIALSFWKLNQLLILLLGCNLSSYYEQCYTNNNSSITKDLTGNIIDENQRSMDGSHGDGLQSRYPSFPPRYHPFQSSLLITDLHSYCSLHHFFLISNTIFLVWSIFTFPPSVPKRIQLLHPEKQTTSSFIKFTQKITNICIK